MRITDYPELEGLREWAEGLWDTAKFDFVDDQGFESVPFDTELSEVVVVGQWGAGGAQEGGHPLKLLYVFDDRGGMDQVQMVVQGMKNHIESDFPILDYPKDPPGPAGQFFTDIQVILPEAQVGDITPPVTEDELFDFLTFEFTSSAGSDEAYSLTRNEVLKTEVGDPDVEFSRAFPPADLPEEVLEELVASGRIETTTPSKEELARALQDPPDFVPQEFANLPAGSIVRDVEGVDGEEVVREEFMEEEPEREDSEPGQVDEDVIEVGDVVLEDQINESKGIIAVPSGKTQTTVVKNRSLFDFEVEMMTVGTDEDIDIDIPDEGIGAHFAMGALEEPPATFPRTGHYIKNRLLHEGPAYVKMLHRDLCRYSWGIIERHKVMVRPGLYENFRQMVYKYKQADLIRPLSQQEAAARGLKVTPETPNGREADFLEDRVWYTLVEGAEEREGWDDVTEFLYG